MCCTTPCAKTVSVLFLTNETNTSTGTIHETDRYDDHHCRAHLFSLPRHHRTCERFRVFPANAFAFSLAHCVITKRTTPLEHDLDRHLIEQRLSRSLRNPMRPSKKDLVEHGIYIDATPRELQMEVM